MDFLQSLLVVTISAIVGGEIRSKFTLFLTDRKENKEAEIRFTNKLKALAHELKVNFQFIGNYQNPFQTKKQTHLDLKNFCAPNFIAFNNGIAELKVHSKKEKSNSLEYDWIVLSHSEM